MDAAKSSKDMDSAAPTSCEPPLWSTILISITQYLDAAFEIRERKTTIGQELFYGYLHFISSLYVLPVIPYQLASAGYNKTDSIEITALASAVGCFISSYVTNLPFVIAPVSSVTIYIAVALQQNGMSQVVTIM